MNGDSEYYWRDSFGGINGPELRSRVQELHRQNIISDNTEVCIFGSTQWLPYKTISSTVNSSSECNQQFDHEAKGTSSIRPPFSSNQFNKENKQLNKSLLPKRKIGLVVLSVLALLGCVSFMWFHCDSMISLIARTPKEMQRSYNIDIDGSVFVVTKNRTNFKLGLVPVRACESHDLHMYLIHDLHPVITPGYLIDMSFKSETDARTEFAKQFDKLQIMSQADKKVAWEKILWHIKERLSALPPAVSGALTDADGKFKMSVPPTISIRLPLIDAHGNYKMSTERIGKCSLVAFAERQVFDATEQYFWVIPLSSEARQTIILSNHNMIGDFDTLLDVIQRGENWPLL